MKCQVFTCLGGNEHIDIDVNGGTRLASAPGECQITAKDVGQTRSL